MANENDPGEKLPIPSFAGVAIFVAGMYLLLYGNKHISPKEWVWYAGIILSGIGIVLWIFSGMTKSQAWEWSKQGAIALAFALVFRWAVAEPYRIPSDSMFPTLDGDEGIGRGDRVFVNKWVYGIRYPFMNKRIWHGQDPQRWDIVVFKSVEPNPMHSTLVKRIVGLPGEEIQIRGGRVFVNGTPLDIPPFLPEDQHYSMAGVYGVSPDPAHSKIPEGSYLVMGDNTESSRDGRYFGWLPNEHIVGRVASIWWPPQRWRDFTGFSGTLWWKALVAITLLWIFLRLFIGRSWPYQPLASDKREHVWINFLGVGLRLPFTRVWLAQWGTPHRDDLVLYHPPKNSRFPGDTLLAGRVAALPRERVLIQEGRLTINGEHPADAPHIADITFTDSREDSVFGRGKGKDTSLVPEDQYFIISEEEDSGAYDSRSLGWVPKNRIVGKGVAIWWPPAKWRRD